MTIEEKRGLVGNYCGRSACDECVLATSGWKHKIESYNSEPCINEDEADEDELDRALALINGATPAACDNCKHCDRDEDTEPCASCKHNQLIGTEAYKNAPENYEPLTAPATADMAEAIKKMGEAAAETVEKIVAATNFRTFSTGAKRDVGGKGRMDLLPWAAIMEVSKHCENGALKYGEHNVDKGIPTSSLCDSAARHLAKHIDGWTDEPHLLAAAWNLLWCIQMELKHPELVDVPWRVKPDVQVDTAEELEQIGEEKGGAE